jgi:hypothetical protein
MTPNTNATAAASGASATTGPESISDLRGRIAREVADLRQHYGALMPPAPEPHPWLMAWHQRPAHQEGLPLAGPIAPQRLEESPARRRT